MATELTFKEGPGGWVRADLHSSRRLEGRYWLCFVQERNRWKAVAMFALGPFSATQHVPVRRIELAVNADEALCAALVARLDDPIPPLGTSEFLASFTGYMRSERFVLKRPPGRRLDDSFYADVARAYRDATARGRNPRAVIAADAGVSSDVAGRWIYEARKPERGFLPRTKPGKVTV
jgi:hypothetical protein